MAMKEKVADEIQCLTDGMRAGSAVVMAAFFSWLDRKEWDSRRKASAEWSV